MKILNFGGIPTSLGEILTIKFYLDQVKHQYSKIILSFHKQLWDVAVHTEAPGWKEKEILWSKFLDQLGELFFSEPPYVLEPISTKYGGNVEHILEACHLTPKKIEMGHLLCKGTSLNIGEYLVLTTKVREADRHIFAPLSIQFWHTLRNLSAKYKIVILGERQVEMRKEYGNDKNVVYSIYEDAICNLPKDRIVDLTVPALSETVTDLAKLQQDCLIMKEAKCVITVGIGGNFTLATAVSNLAVGFRTDKNVYGDVVFNRDYPNAIITKDWNRFIEVLKVL
jgi:hypothetical protein